MEILRHITGVWMAMFISAFDSKTDVISNDARQILSNPDDRDRYIKAVDELKKNPSTPQKVELSDHKEITLIA